MPANPVLTDERFHLAEPTTSATGAPTEPPPTYAAPSRSRRSR